MHDHGRMSTFKGNENVKKADPIYTFYCGWCDKRLGESAKSKLPVSVICPSCMVAGHPVVKVGKGKPRCGRNYPTEYFENQ